MKYSGDAFHTFMDFDSAIYLAVNGTVTSLPVFIQNILNCVLKTNEAFTGSERHGGKWKNYKIFILGWSIPLTTMYLHLNESFGTMHLLCTYFFIYCTCIKKNTCM